MHVALLAWPGRAWRPTRDKEEEGKGRGGKGREAKGLFIGLISARSDRSVDIWPASGEAVLISV